MPNPTPYAAMPTAAMPAAPETNAAEEARFAAWAEAMHSMDKNGALGPLVRQLAACPASCRTRLDFVACAFFLLGRTVEQEMEGLEPEESETLLGCMHHLILFR